MNIETMTKILASSQRNGGTRLNSHESTGDCQPPKNITAVSVLISSMLAYSAMKNSAKLIPEYSIMWPATISDSPSTTSNGARLVSATPETKYTTSIGASGSQFQERKVRPLSANQPRPWPLTMLERYRPPDTISTTTRAKPMASS